MAERLSRPGVAFAEGESKRALLLRGRLLTNLLGTAVVLACIALPFILAEISVAIEEGAAGRYIQTLRATATTVDSTAAQTPGRPRLLDQHYYFVNGCVSAPQYCVRAETSYWGEYYEELRRLYEEAAMLSAYAPVPVFDEWAEEHVHFIIAQHASTGADDITRALEANGTSSGIHIVATSTGGSATFTYLSRSMRGEVSLDRRILSVFTVDSPLGHWDLTTWDNIISGLQASAMKIDLAPGIGDWARAANIAMLTVDTREDGVGHSPVPGITNDPNPTYTQSDTPVRPVLLSCGALPCQLLYMSEFLETRSIWHIYTGSHMADSARDFVEGHWR